MWTPGRSGPVAIALALTVLSVAAQNSIAQTPVDTSVSGGASVSIPDDLNLLVGKQVVVGRMALCVPKTYNVNLSYSGKTAKVVSFTRNASLDGIKGNLRSLPPSTQAMMTDLMKGGLVQFEFGDGTRLDNCGSIGWATIAAALELAPGELISLPAKDQSVAALTPGLAGALPPTGAVIPQKCPVSVAGLSSGVSLTHMFVEALTTSEFERQVDETIHNGQTKHYLDVRVHNDSERPVAAYEFGTIYMNRMGDPSATAAYISQNSHPIKPGGDDKTSTMDRDLSAQSGTGQVRVYITRIKFDDGSTWQGDGTRSCTRTTNVE